MGLVLCTGLRYSLVPLNIAKARVFTLWWTICHSDHSDMLFFQLPDEDILEIISYLNTKLLRVNMSIAITY
jgi:hypothetical protein